MNDDLFWALVERAWTNARPLQAALRRREPVGTDALADVVAAIALAFAFDPEDHANTFSTTWRAKVQELVTLTRTSAEVACLVVALGPATFREARLGQWETASDGSKGAFAKLAGRCSTRSPPYRRWPVRHCQDRPSTSPTRPRRWSWDAEGNRWATSSRRGNTMKTIATALEAYDGTGADGGLRGGTPGATLPIGLVILNAYAPSSRPSPWPAGRAMEAPAPDAAA